MPLSAALLHAVIIAKRSGWRGTDRPSPDTSAPSVRAIVAGSGFLTPPLRGEGYFRALAGAGPAESICESPRFLIRRFRPCEQYCSDMSQCADQYVASRGDIELAFSERGTLRKAKLMGHILHQHRPQNRVTAVFESGAFSFEVSDCVALGHLAGRLTRMGEQQGEMLTAVTVTHRSPAPIIFSWPVAIQRTVWPSSRVGAR